VYNCLEARGNLARIVWRLDIATFGRDFGSIALESERGVTGESISRRRSQLGCAFLETGVDRFRARFGSLVGRALACLVFPLCKN
jgi:hypothetical protein